MITKHTTRAPPTIFIHIRNIYHSESGIHSDTLVRKCLHSSCMVEPFNQRNTVETDSETGHLEGKNFLFITDDCFMQCMFYI